MRISTWQSRSAFRTWCTLTCSGTSNLPRRGPGTMQTEWEHQSWPWWFVNLISQSEQLELCRSNEWTTIESLNYQHSKLFQDFLAQNTTRSTSWYFGKLGKLIYNSMLPCPGRAAPLYMYRSQLQAIWNCPISLLKFQTFRNSGIDILAESV